MGHIHSDDQYDFTASAVIVHDDKVLLLFHSKHDLWLNPGGHIELDETPLKALYREAEEETGIAKENLTLYAPYADHMEFERDETNLTEPMPFDIDIHVATDGGHQHIDMAYILRSNTDQVILEADKATDIKWFTIPELEELPNLRKTVLSRAKYAIDFVKGSTV